MSPGAAAKPRRQGRDLVWQWRARTTLRLLEAAVLTLALPVEAGQWVATQWVDDGSTLATRVALANLGSGAHNVTVAFRDDTGAELAASTAALAAGAVVVVSTASLGGLTGTSTNSGSLVVHDPSGSADLLPVATLYVAQAGVPEAAIVNLEWAFDPLGGGGGGSTSDLSLAKTVAPGAAALGENATFTFTVSNAGPDNAVAVRIDDPMPDGLLVVGTGPGCTLVGNLVSCSAPVLPAGSSASFTATVTPNASSLPPLALSLSGDTRSGEAGIFALAPVDGRDAALAVGDVLGNSNYPQWPVTPRGVAREPGGTLVVCDAGDTRILLDPTDVNGDGRILRLDPATGAVTPIHEYDTIANPTGVVVAPDGTIYVADEYTARRDEIGNPAADLTGSIRRLSSPTYWPDVVSEKGLLVRPLGIDLDPVDGSLVVADGSGMVLRIDPATGNQTPISGGGLLGEPRAVAVEAPGKLLVVDGTSGIVRIDAATGGQALVAPLGPPSGLSDPWDLALSDGLVWVADAAGDGALIVIEQATGGLVDSLASPTWGPLRGVEATAAFLNRASVSHAGSDPLPTNDVAAALLEHGGGYTPAVEIAVVETVSVTDAVTALPAVVIAVAEGITVGDVVETLPVLAIAILEDIAVSDQVAALPAVAIAVAEGITVGDVVETLPVLAIAILEDIAVSDQVAVLPAVMLGVSESVAVTDTVAALPAVLLAVAESVQVRDTDTVSFAGAPGTLFANGFENGGPSGR
jgi:uncharacterized repeat protein (TIGR01451 family)